MTDVANRVRGSGDGGHLYLRAHLHGTEGLRPWR